jgi:hypothetical protein
MRQTVRKKQYIMQTIRRDKMNKRETATILATLKVAYPVFYSKFTENDIANTVNLWENMFSQCDYKMVSIAVQELIKEHSGYPPDIATLQKKIDSMIEMAIGEPTDEELWNLLKNAASNGYYGAEQEFQKLPKVLKTYLGSPSTLREYAQMEESTFNTVTKGQFLKQIKSIKDRVKADTNTPENVKELFAGYMKRLDVGYKPLSPGELNDRRNNILDKLENKNYES